MSQASSQVDVRPPVGGPIADLSYRNYDGPLRNRAARWWIVALSGIRIVVRKWYFWLFVAFAGLPFLLAGFGLYLQNQAQGAVMMANPMAAAAVGERKVVYANLVLTSLDASQIWFFSLALAVGAGAIAADMQANALLVYLSKPLTRLDYLAGKWVSVFAVVYAAAGIPAILFWLYCFFSYNAQGFFKNEPYLLPQILAACAIPAAVHASLVLACSAWSRSGRQAGAVYAALYFISATVAGMLFAVIHRGNIEEGYLTRQASVGGVIKALWHNLFDVTLQETMFHRRRGFGQIDIVPQDGAVFAAVAGGLIILALFLTWSRIRAVEVVRG
jgi:ABC-2 type transport system permease protein